MDPLTVQYYDNKGSIRPSEVIDRLLRIPVHRRNVSDARRVYLDLPFKECVWSGKNLGADFDVDHILPFSLWRNNDLWNLLPANSRTNRDKGDSLPMNSLLKRRKEIILGYWNVMHKAHPRRFEHEVRSLAGSRDLDLSRTFNVMLEAVEITTQQRGCRQWDPTAAKT